MSELAPCPLCGSAMTLKDSVVEFHRRLGRGGGSSSMRRRRRTPTYLVACVNKECPLSEYCYNTPEGAIESWNKSRKVNVNGTLEKSQ